MILILTVIINYSYIFTIKKFYLHSSGVPLMGSEVPLVDIIDQLGVEVVSQRSKNPRVLQLAARCCRAMAGEFHEV